VFSIGGSIALAVRRAAGRSPAFKNGQLIFARRAEPKKMAIRRG
jgi:hypothetical protein